MEASSNRIDNYISRVCNRTKKQYKETNNIKTNDCVILLDLKELSIKLKIGINFLGIKDQSKAGKIILDECVEMVDVEIKEQQKRYDKELLELKVKAGVVKPYEKDTQ